MPDRLQAMPIVSLMVGSLVLIMDIAVVQRFMPMKQIAPNMVKNT